MTTNSPFSEPVHDHFAGSVEMVGGPSSTQHGGGRFLHKSSQVKYYRGDLSAGVFDTAHCEQIKTIKGIGYLDLKKTGSAKAGYVGVIAEILTNFGNKHLVYKKIDVPYNDLN